MNEMACTPEVIELAKLICELIEKKPNLKVLDVGCGHGFCKTFLKDCYYQGIDSIKYRSFKGNFTKIDLDNENFPFENDSFDVVICSAVLEHLNYPEKAIIEIKRVLKKAGYCIIALPNELTIDNRLRYLFAFKTFNSLEENMPHHWFFTIKSAKAFVEKYFTIIEKKYQYGVKGGRLLPFFIRNFLANVFPSVFAFVIILKVRK